MKKMVRLLQSFEEEPKSKLVIQAFVELRVVDACLMLESGITNSIQ